MLNILNGNLSFMKIILVTMFCFNTLTLFAQEEIKVEEAVNHVGDSVKICSKVYGAKYLEIAKGSPTFLNIGGRYPNTPLTIIIWCDVRKQFENRPDAFIKTSRLV